jgi:hypothetical protein
VGIQIQQEFSFPYHLTINKMSPSGGLVKDWFAGEAPIFNEIGRLMVYPGLAGG